MSRSIALLVVSIVLASTRRFEGFPKYIGVLNEYCMKSLAESKLLKHTEGTTNH